MKLSILLFTLLILTSNAYSQLLQNWERHYNGSGNYIDFGSKVALDDSGNVYVCGTVYGSGTLNDYILIKYNPAGVQKWLVTYNGPGNQNDNPTAIRIVNSNIYVTGLSFGGGTSYDYATLKYNLSGVLQWASRYNGPGSGNDAASGLEVDGSGNVFVTGQAYGGSSTAYDFATVKYNSAGIQQWVVSYNGTANSNDAANDIALDSSGNVFVTGQSIGSASFDYTTIKYNSSGVQQWVKLFNGPGNDIDVSKFIATNSQGQIIVSGYSKGTGSSFDFATIKYDTAGNVLWNMRYNGIVNSSDIPSDMELDNAGNIYLTGVTNSDVSGAQSNYVTIKYNPAGIISWLATYNGTANSNDSATSIAVSSSGDTYVTGKSIGTGSLFDCVTLHYSPTGVLQHTARYSSTGNHNDIANSLAIDNAGTAYITGFTNVTGSADDILTIKYAIVIGITTLSENIPDAYQLSQNYPNPFNPVTKINYSLVNPGLTKVKIFDLLGNEIETLVNENQQPGTYSVEWNGSNFASGTYYYKLETENFSETKKMILVK